MNRQSAIDEPVVLGDLLGSDELREIAQLYRHAYGVDVSILDRAGLLVSSAVASEDVRVVLEQALAQAEGVLGREPVRVAGPEPGTALMVGPLIYDGQRLATFAIGPYRLGAGGLATGSARGAPPEAEGPSSARPMAGANAGPGTGSTGETDAGAATRARTRAVGRGDTQSDAQADTLSDAGADTLNDALTGTQADALARTLARHAAGMMEILVHHAYTRYLTSTLHAATIEQTFAELAAKNQRLELAVEHMQEVDRLKSSFLATMSHELRTPLTSVIGYAEMLHEGLAGPMNNEQRDYLQTILSKADQLLQLITGLLEASVLENGPLPMQAEPLALRELVESEISAMGPQVHTRRIELLPVTPDLPRALGDARRVRQVVRNLVANAIKFTGDGGVIRVEVQVGFLFRNADASAMRGLRVVIADSGIGIPPEKQEHVFEPFFQVDASSTRRYGGTGLGLTLAKSYIEANGGQIWVESTLGKGSAFTFSLPAEPEDLARFLARSADP